MPGHPDLVHYLSIDRERTQATGHQGARHFTAQDRISERTNWRTIQLLLDNGVFLLMGYQIVTVVGDCTAGVTNATK